MFLVVIESEFQRLAIVITRGEIGRRCIKQGDYYMWFIIVIYGDLWRFMMIFSDLWSFIVIFGDLMMI